MIVLKILAGVLVAVIVAYLTGWWVQAYQQARKAGAVKDGRHV